MPFMIFSGDDYYPCGGWSDHDKTCATFEQARLAMMKLRGDWLHIVNTETGERTDYLWANKQWMLPEDAQAWLAEESAKERAEFDRTHVKLPPGAAYCGDCTITGYCSCGKYGKGEAA